MSSEFAMATHLLSPISKESVAQTHDVHMTTDTPSGNTSVIVSPLTTADSPITLNATQVQTKAVLTPSVSTVSLASTVSEERVVGADYTTDTISTTMTASDHDSVPVTPWITVSFTLTLPAVSSNTATPSAVDGSFTTSATALVSPSTASFTVTFNDVSPTGTGQDLSISIIDQPTQPALTTTAATAGTSSPSTTSGGTKAAPLVYGGLVAMVACLLAGVSFAL